MLPERQADFQVEKRGGLSQDARTGVFVRGLFYSVALAWFSRAVRRRMGPFLWFNRNEHLRVW